MQTWDAIRARRDIREYADRPVDAAHLERILEAGRRAPSSNNSQTWDFVVVNDRDELRRLSDASGAPQVARATTTIALVSPTPENAVESDRIQYDLGQTTMSIMLAAADLGIGTAHAAVKDPHAAHKALAFPPTASVAI